MSEVLKIREVRPEDFDRWLMLWNDYNAFYGRSGASALPESITAATWNRFFDAAEPVHCLVAERDGEVVGLVHYLFHRTTISIVPTCYLQDLFTDASMRGQGIGRKLIEAVCDRAKSAGAARVYWITHETNITAMRLYDSLAERSGFLVYRKNF